MKCPSVNWDLLAMEALEGEGVESMLAHARICDTCRTRLEAARRAHVDRVRMYEAFDRDHDLLREQLMAALPDELPHRSGGDRLVLGVRRLGDYVMSLNSTRTRRAAVVLAPAACIVIAVGVFLSSGQRSAFAAAIEHLRQARTIVCHVTKTTSIRMQADPQAGPSTVDPSMLARLDQAPQTEMIRNEKLYMSAEHGVRRDVYEDGALTRTVYTRENGAGLILHRTARTYEAFDDEGEMPEAFQEAAARAPKPDVHFMALSSDPDRLIRGLRNLTAGADRELGRDNFDGHEVIGYEIAGEKVGFGPPWTDNAKENRAELWVDAKNDVPVRLVFHYAQHVSGIRELPVATSFTLTTVYDQFEWDSPLPADWFEAIIPDGYKAHEDVAAVKVPPPSEEAFLLGLEAFAEMTDRYPSSLNAMSLGYEISVLSSTLRAKQLAARHAGRPEPEGPDTESLSKVLGLTFYTFLEMTGREPEYFGAQVNPGEAEKTLIRWTLEDGNTRVIYGNLGVETLSSSQEPK